MAKKRPPKKKMAEYITTDWLHPKDIDQVSEIDEENFEYPWEKDDFVSYLNRVGNIGRVAKYNNQIVGFSIFRLERNHLHIFNFAVRSDFLRQGVGTELMREMIENRVNQRRDHINLAIHEENKLGWDFLIANGYGAKLLRNYWEEAKDPHYDSGDAYLMRLNYIPRPRFKREKKSS